MQYDLDRQENNNEPSLAEMTRKAIQILKKDPQGYFLFVEGIFVQLRIENISFVMTNYSTWIAYIFALQNFISMLNDHLNPHWKTNEDVFGVWKFWFPLSVDSVTVVIART